MDDVGFAYYGWGAQRYLQSVRFRSTGPHDLIITEEMAHKYFADEDPIGKTLTYKGIVLTVTGVAKSLPHNSLVQLGLLLPLSF